MEPPAVGDRLPEEVERVVRKVQQVLGQAVSHEQALPMQVVKKYGDDILVVTIGDDVGLTDSHEVQLTREEVDQAEAALGRWEQAKRAGNSPLGRAIIGRGAIEIAKKLLSEAWDSWS